MLMLCLSAQVLRAQGKDSVAHSPTKAWLMSAVVPGLGQAYNQRYWKIPVVYGGFVAFSYFIQTNNFRYKLYLDAYDIRFQMEQLDKLSEAYGALEKQLEDKYPQLKNAPANRLQYYKNSYRRDRDFFIIMTVLFYIVNMVDAAVDAHFFTYDISNDLSLNWQPYVNEGIYASSPQIKPTVGLNFNITF